MRKKSNFKEWWFIWTSFFLGIIFMGIVVTRNIFTVPINETLISVIGYLFVANAVIILISAIIGFFDKKVTITEAMKVAFALINLLIYGVIATFTSIF